MKDSINTDTFIEEIQTHPAIWNYHCEEYTNRIEKTKAWEQVCEVFNANFNQLSNKEKNEFSMQLQRKWKSLRDSYNREFNRKKNSNSGDRVTQRKQYIYFKQLSFLQPLADQRRTATSTVLEKCLQDIPTEREENTRSTRKLNKKKRSKEDEHEEPLPSVDERTETKQHEEQNETDSDRLFLLSLQSDLKKVPEDLKSDAKCEIMHILKRYKRQNSYMPHFGPSAYVPLSAPHYVTQALPATTFLPLTSLDPTSYAHTGTHVPSPTSSMQQHPFLANCHSPASSESDKDSTIQPLF